MEKNNTRTEQPITSYSGTRVHEVQFGGVRAPLVFIERENLNSQHIYKFAKRAFDLVISVIGSIILAVPVALLCLIIWIDDPHGSPIFVQNRVGKDGKIFKIYKLRSMYVDAEDHLAELLDQNDMKSSPTFKMKNDPRITRVGKFIRSTGLDEVVQLINIVSGTMSLVGPRPALPREAEEYNAYQRQRLMVKPGLTCTWQIQPDRNRLSFDSWIYLDLKYIQERGFLGDLKIIFRTFSAVIHGYGW